MWTVRALFSLAVFYTQVLAFDASKWQSLERNIGRHGFFKTADPKNCGSWHQRYTKLHQREVLKGGAGRYLYHVCDEGQADCLVGAVSAFYIALLSKRAFFTGKFSFQYHGGVRSGALDDAFEIQAGGLDWRIPDALYHEHVVNGEHALLIGESIDHATDNQIRRIVARSLGPDQSMVLLSNAGVIHRLFNIKAVRNAMQRLGVVEDHAFGCALDYMFQPRPDIMNEFLEELFVLRDPERPPVIGLHLRSGDNVFTNKSYAGDGVDIVRRKFSSAFDCVRQVSTYLEASGRVRPIIYVLSDDVDVRAAVPKILTDKSVLVNTNIVPQHTGPYQMATTVSSKGLQAAAIEFWLFGEADVQITYSLSGYGRASAARSIPFKPMRVHVIKNYTMLQSCLPRDEVTFEAISKMKPGI
jgi:hypothetical protein